MRADVEAAHFTVDGVAERLGPEASAALHREELVPALLATDPATSSTPLDPCGALVRLFTLGRPLAVEVVARALPTLGVAGAQDLGLVRVVGPEVVAACDLRPYGDDDHDWWVASDVSGTATGEPLRPDHVLGIGGASTTLASWTIRRPVERALDLGTGCGVQSLHLTDHARSITATDISERALAYAAFNGARRRRPRRGSR